jgi:predicted O-methyltransferase YrrM
LAYRQRPIPADQFRLHWSAHFIIEQPLGANRTSAAADWDEQAQYFELVVKLTRQHGCIFVDNAFRQLSESAAGRDPERGEALVKSAEVDSRATATFIPTLGTHRKTELLENIDGFLMAILN